MTQIYLDNDIDTVHQEKYDKLLEDLNQLNLIQQDLLKCVHDQSEQVSNIEDNMIRTDLNVESGANDLKTAEKYFFNYKPILIGTAIGALVGGPIGAAIHLKMGSLLTLGGGVVGGMFGYKIQKL